MESLAPQTPAAPKSGVSAFVDSLKKEKEGVKEEEEVTLFHQLCYIPSLSLKFHFLSIQSPPTLQSKEKQAGSRSPLTSVVELLSSLALTQGEAKVVLTRWPEEVVF